MNRDEYRQIRELYHQLADVGLDERRRILEGLTVPDPIRSELDALLEHEPRLFDQVDLRELIGAPGEGPDWDGENARLPEQIAGFQIDGLLGRGGMGVVYRGTQKHPKREVAIKVVHSFSHDPERVRRFEYEAEALARIDHPYVTKVFQAGVDRELSDLPYIVMELIEGQDLVSYCDANDMGVRERLELFQLVCDGVAHAHRGGIVHRDLKPANILVNADGRPKILDFGIARPTVSDEDVTPGRTMTGDLLGSLAWMSPEQARGDVRAIDTRTDVYSLGVILYRLLSGTMPYRTEGLPPWEAARALCEAPPRRIIGAAPGLDADVEAIVMMAIEKAPERRYPSAEALGRDIGRYLALQPVEARTWSKSYQLRQFVRRHRAAMATAAGAFLALLIGSVFLTFGLLRAQSELAYSKEISRLLSEMLASVSPEIARSEDTTLLRRLLQETAARLDRGEVEEPRIEGELRAIVGDTLRKLGDTVEAERHLRRSMELLPKELGPSHPMTVQASIGLVFALSSLDRYDEAQAEVRRTMSLSGLSEDDRAHALNVAAVVCLHTSRLEEGLELAQHARAIARKRFPEGDPLALNIETAYANILTQLGEYDRAEPVCERVVAIGRRTLGDDSPVVILALGELASVYEAQGRWSDALPVVLEQIDLSRKVHGERMVPTQVARGAAARLLVQLGHVEEAHEFWLSAIEQQRANGGRADSDAISGALATLTAPPSPDLLEHLRQATAEARAAPDLPEEDAFELDWLRVRVDLVYGGDDSVLPVLEKLVSHGVELLGMANLQVLYATNALAVEYTSAGQIAQARGLLENALIHCEEYSSPELVCPVIRHSYAETYLATGELERAVEELEEAVDAYRSYDGVTGEPQWESLVRLAFEQLWNAHAQIGNREAASDAQRRWIVWRQEALADRETPPAALAEFAEAVLNLPHAELRDGRLALSYAERACEAVDPIDPNLEATRARCLVALGETALARSALQHALDNLPPDADASSIATLQAALAAID